MVIKCVLCGEEQKGLTTRGKKKVFNKHHIDYDNDVTMVLCYTCHSLVHCRCRFGNSYEVKYGKDKGFYMLSKAFIKVYEQFMLGV